MIKWRINVMTANDGTTKTWRETDSIQATEEQCVAHLERLLTTYAEVEAVAPGGFTLFSENRKINSSDTVTVR